MHLFLKGKIVDTISSVSEPANWTENRGQWEQELYSWKEWIGIARTVRKSYRKESIETVFWRTLFIDSEDWLTLHSVKINIEAQVYWDYVVKLQRWFEYANPSDTGSDLGSGLPDHILIRANVTHARKWTKGKRACATETGLFGLALPNTQIGDKVVYLASASIPHLLRRVQGGKTETWRLVGPVYVHGIMNGEKYPKIKWGLKDIFLV